MAVPGWAAGPSDPPRGGGDTTQRNGYRIVPIHPTADEVFGEKVYRSLVEVPFDVDVVDVFRRAEYLGEEVDDAIAKGVKIGIGDSSVSSTRPPPSMVARPG